MGLSTSACVRASPSDFVACMSTRFGRTCFDRSQHHCGRLSISGTWKVIMKPSAVAFLCQLAVAVRRRPIGFLSNISTLHDCACAGWPALRRQWQDFLYRGPPEDLPMRSVTHSYRRYGCKSSFPLGSVNMAGVFSLVAHIFFWTRALWG